MQRTISALSFAVIGGHTQVVEFVLKQNQLQKGIYEVNISVMVSISSFTSAYIIAEGVLYYSSKNGENLLGQLDPDSDGRNGEFKSLYKIAALHKRPLYF